MLDLLIILKGIGIPITLLEARNGFYASLDTVDADVVGPYSHNGPMVEMRLVDCSVFGPSLALPQNP